MLPKLSLLQTASTSRAEQSRLNSPAKSPAEMKPENLELHLDKLVFQALFSVETSDSILRNKQFAISSARLAM